MGVFLHCWGVSYALRGLILLQSHDVALAAARSWRTTPSHLDWGHEGHPLGYKDPEPSPKSGCKALRMCEGINDA